MPVRSTTPKPDGQECPSYGAILPPGATGGSLEPPVFLKNTGERSPSPVALDTRLVRTSSCVCTRQSTVCGRLGRCKIGRARFSCGFLNVGLCRGDSNSMLLALLPQIATQPFARRGSPVPHESSTPWPPPQQWLEDARSGSTEALGWLFNAYQPDLLKIAESDEERVLLRKVDAVDLVQQVFLEAHRDWPQFFGETPAELLAWLRQILRHKLANLSRWFHNQKHDVRREIPFTERNSADVCTERPSDGDGPSGGVNLGGGGQAGVVERMLARLPEHDRRVIVLRLREDRSVDEIAGLIDRSPAAVRKLLSRALAKARKNLEQHS